MKYFLIPYLLGNYVLWSATMDMSDADLSLANNDGNTALHLAAFFAYPDLVKLLLKHGASIGAKNGRGETPLSLVSGDWNPDLENAYTSIGNAINMQIDLIRVRQARPKVAGLPREQTTE